MSLNMSYGRYVAATGVMAALWVTGCHHDLARSALKKTAVSQTAVSQAIARQIANAASAGDGDYQLRTLRARMEANPADIAARLEIAERYQQLGFPELALDHARLLLERVPESEDAHVALAKLQRAADQSAEAERALVAFSTKHDASARLWAWIGLLRDDTGDWKNGEIAHRKAVAMAPDRDELHNNLGFCLLQQGRKDEAAAEFAAALKLNPRSIVARNNLGTSLNTSSKEAVLHLQSVTDPATAHSNLAAALMDAGRYDEARQELGLALGYNRQHSAAMQNLELLARLDGKPVELKSSSRPEGKWARLAVSAWRRFWGFPPQVADIKGTSTSTEAGPQVAARK